MADHSQNRKTGNMGESVACDFLEKNGYKLIERNYYCKYGEIDIIVEDEKHIIFVEVKTRAEFAKSRYGRPRMAVNYTKQQHLLNSVYTYMHERKPGKSPRIDVIEVLYSRISDSTNYQFKINHIKAAVGGR